MFISADSTFSGLPCWHKETSPGRWCHRLIVCWVWPALTPTSRLIWFGFWRIEQQSRHRCQRTREWLGNYRLSHNRNLSLLAMEKGMIPCGRYRHFRVYFTIYRPDGRMYLILFGRMQDLDVIWFLLKSKQTLIRGITWYYERPDFIECWYNSPLSSA